MKIQEILQSWEQYAGFAPFPELLAEITETRFLRISRISGLGTQSVKWAMENPQNAVQFILNHSGNRAADLFPIFELHFRGMYNYQQGRYYYQEFIERTQDEPFGVNVLEEQHEN